MMRRIKIFISCIGVIMLLAPFVVFGQSNAQQPSLANFDEDVAMSRRLIRQYCAIVQTMVPEASVDPEKQKKALGFLKEGIEKWAAVQKNYSTNPPAVYAKDPQRIGRHAQSLGSRAAKTLAAGMRFWLRPLRHHA